MIIRAGDNSNHSTTPFLPLVVILVNSTMFVHINPLSPQTAVILLTTCWLGSLLLAVLSSTSAPLVASTSNPGARNGSSKPYNPTTPQTESLLQWVACALLLAGRSIYSTYVALLQLSFDCYHGRRLWQSLVKPIMAVHQGANSGAPSKTFTTASTPGVS